MNDSMCELMSNYLVCKQYDNHYGDMVPMIISNSIKGDGFIILEWQDGLTTDILITSYWFSKVVITMKLVYTKQNIKLTRLALNADKPSAPFDP